MFIKNDNLQKPRRHLEFFLPSRPYRGEPPTVAGFLLYPDAPAKMETTSREAFCLKQLSQRDRGKGDLHVNPNTRQEFHLCPPTSSRKAGRGNGSKDCEPGEDEQEGNNDRTKEQDAEEMQSQYQKDFPPPSCCRGRRTPAPPQADNIGINPAFRIDFSTVQRETFPGWPAVNPSCAARLRRLHPDNQKRNK
ncbi:uncharacterized protein si:dkeyp-69c1.9 [Pseudoliparis swirei]|uniref:uncharacterized protein si:dkeyp-69c1.9 n=1 Tax=Pseudoliparis swirei TaxID=2059687 RepID=UPI0024BD9285|nr:uncharacterized protein si:dkeyp-69c1.9 [Pseudoliparis swirei]XP_056295709.1 uncharacterized protein si:dkeyp-69c1.9 [Pseudoliparis swirei]